MIIDYLLYYMTYRIIPKPLEIPAPEPPVELSTQTTTTPTLPDGGTTASPNSGTVTEILAASTEYRSTVIKNEGPGTVHLYLGDVPAAWESAPKSAQQIEPGGVAVSTLESSQTKLSGWSEGGTADLIIDVVV